MTRINTKLKTHKSLNVIFLGQNTFSEPQKELSSSHDNSWKTNGLASNDVVLASRQLASKLQVQTNVGGCGCLNDNDHA